MSVSSAGGFDEACGFATVLARRPILDERMKLRFGLHAQKLLQRSAFCENFRQASAKQIVEQETWRTRRANASNISLLSDVEAVAGEGNGCVSVRVGKVIDATEDRLFARVTAAPSVSTVRSLHAITRSSCRCLALCDVLR